MTDILLRSIQVPPTNPLKLPSNNRFRLLNLHAFSLKERRKQIPDLLRRGYTLTYLVFKANKPWYMASYERHQERGSNTIRVYYTDFRIKKDKKMSPYLVPYHRDSKEMSWTEGVDRMSYSGRNAVYATLDPGILEKPMMQCDLANLMLRSGCKLSYATPDDSPFEPSHEKVHFGDGETDIWVDNMDRIWKYVGRNRKEFIFTPGSASGLCGDAFSYHTELERVDLHDMDVTIIPHAAFACCSGLKEVVLPPSTTCIQACAFCKCSSLETLDLSGLTNLREVGNDCFYGCKSLRTIILPQSIEKTGVCAFEECDNLKYISPHRIKFDFYFHYIITNFL